MRKHVTLCLNCLHYVPLGGVCGCGKPAPVYMSEAAAKKFHAKDAKDAKKGKADG